MDIDLPSVEMRRVYALISRVAATDATVLVTGESGVGKEHIARRVHVESRRAGGPFIPINCGALSDGLLETELFGHMRGAFTGAAQDHAGLFEAADGGTMFLDEVGEVSPAMQVRLLRVLQSREIRRVGDTRVRRADTRIVAATNRNLAADVTSGRFRQDLYYRLRVIDVHVPPLRYRRPDLMALMDRLLAETAERYGRRILDFSPQARQLMAVYSWPGNIRELAHSIERACVVTEGPSIEVHDLPEAVRSASSSPQPPDVTTPTKPLREVEREYVRMVLDQHQGNRQRAARELQISLATLKRKLNDAAGSVRSPRP